MANQRLHTSLLLDASLTSGYKDAFSSASKLMSDLNRHSNALEKELKQLGRKADDLDKIGDSSDVVRRDMQKLERQIKSTQRAVGRFSTAKTHFRNAKIGASAFKQELSDMIGFASRAALGVAGIGTAAAVALAPPEELQEFDAALAGIRAISVGVEPSSIERSKAQILELSNFYGVQASEIAAQFKLLTRSLGFEGATQSIQAALDFQTATGTGIPEIEEELATARISLGIDTATEMESFLGLLQKAYSVGIKIENLDLGDLETLTARVGTDVDSDAFQREFLTTIAFRQVDSFQFADYAAAFKEEIDRATLISPEMDVKAILKAQNAIQTLEKYGIRAEDGLVGAMRVYQQLNEVERVAFFQELEPVLTAMPAEVIARGSEALPNIEAQVNMALGDTGTLSEASGEMLESWSATWGRIGTTGRNTIGILQASFAEAFGPSTIDGAQRLFDFLSANEDKVKNFFTGVRDGMSPVINKVWSTVKSAWPDIKEFATEAWDELRGHWNTIAPPATAVAQAIWNILRPVLVFVKEHPRLVATVLAGIAVWKAYQIASTGVQTVYDFLAGGVSLLQGHYHKLNATVLGNQRALGNAGNVALDTGRKFLEMGRNVLSMKFPRWSGAISGLTSIGRSAVGAIPGIAAMGGSLWAAIAPVLPVILPIIAAVGVLAGLGYLVYQNWEPLKAFFVDNFETIRNVLTLVFPPIGILIGLAGVIRDNWEPIKAFFAELWETIRLSAGIAWEAIQFVALTAVTSVKELWGGITGFFTEIWTGVQGVFLNSPLAPIFETMVAGIKTVFSPLVSFFSDIWGGISEAANKALGWITEKLDGINKVLGGLMGWFKDKNTELKTDLGIENRTNTDMVVNQAQPIVQLPEQQQPVLQIQRSPVIDQTQPIVNSSLQDTESAPTQIQMQRSPVVTFEPIGGGEPVIVEKVVAPDVTEILQPTSDTPTDVSPQETIDYTPVPDATSAAAATPPAQVSTTTTETNNGGTVHVTNQFTIQQQPGQDPEELAEMIAQIMEKQLNDAPGSFLTQ